MLEEDQIVKGIVVRHEVYGAFVEIGEPELAALLLDALVDGDMSEARHSLPQVGDHIRAVFLGYGGGTQPRLGIRPSDFLRASRAQKR